VAVVLVQVKTLPKAMAATVDLVVVQQLKIAVAFLPTAVPELLDKVMTAVTCLITTHRLGVPVVVVLVVREIMVETVAP
jgi:hypothetical protein